MAQRKPESMLRRIWQFLWHEDSVASWTASILLSFLLIKFAVYPLLGIVLGTTFPVVAVISPSMEHPDPFETWWSEQQDNYLRYNITRDDFLDFPLRSGFNKGDIIFLVGTPAERIEQGDVIVFWGGKAYPIIHRVIAVRIDDTGARYFETKGDNNRGQIYEPPYLDERYVPVTRPCRESETGSCPVLLGRAVFRVPYLGWVKIGFVNLLGALGVPVA